MKLTSRRSRARNALSIAVAEALEPRQLLSVPPAPPQVIEPDPTVDLSQARDGHFVFENNPHELHFHFSSPVVIQPGALTVHSEYNDWQPRSVLGMSGSGTDWTFTIDTALSIDNYDAILNADLVTDASTGEPLDGNGDGVGGDDYETTFFFLTADVNHDRSVDETDNLMLDELVHTYGGHPGGYAEGDINENGWVGDESDTMGSLFGTVLPAPLTAPNTLAATAVYGRGRIDISWNPPPEDDDRGGFNVYRSLDGGVTYNWRAEVDDPNATTWTDTGLQDGQKGYYRVRAWGYEDGESPATNTAKSVTVLPMPEHVAATPVDSNSVNLTWTDSSTGAISFVVQIEPSDGSPSWTETVDQSGPGPISYTVTDLSPDTEYYFEVTALTDAQSSSSTIPLICGTFSPITVAADANAEAFEQDQLPATFTLTRHVYDDSEPLDVEFALDGSAQSGVDYSFSPHLGADPSLQIAHFDAGSDTSTVTVTPMTSGGNGNPQVTLTLLDGGDSYSVGSPSTGTITLYEKDAAVTAPMGLQVSGTQAEGEVGMDVSWDAVNGATFYVIERSSDENFSANDIQQFQVDAQQDGTEFHDSSAGDIGGTFYYRILAATDTGTSTWSPPTAGTVPSMLPASPDEFYAVPVTDGTLLDTGSAVRLTWNDRSGPGTTYRIERATDQDFSDATTITTVPDDEEEEVSIGDFYGGYMKAFGSPALSAFGDLSLPNWFSDDLGMLIGANETVQVACDNTNPTPGDGSHYTVTVPADAILINNTSGYWGVSGTDVVTIDQGSSSFTIQGDQVAQVSDLQAAGFATRDASQGVTNQEMIDRSWISSDGSAQYKLAVVGDTPVVDTDVEDSVATYTDTTMPADGTYYYRVWAQSDAGDSYSPTPLAEVTMPLAPPTQPDAVVWPIDASSNEIEWTDRSDNEAAFVVRRSATQDFTDPTATILGYAPANTSSFTDTTITPGVQYYYQVAAVNDWSASGSELTASSPSSVASFTYMAPVRVATTANIANLAGGAPAVVDGVTLAANDRILVKNQTSQSKNGIYVVSVVGSGANGTWTRAADADATGELVSGSYVLVGAGSTNANTAWVVTTTGTITVGTTPVNWVEHDGGIWVVGSDGKEIDGATVQHDDPNDATNFDPRLTFQLKTGVHVFLPPSSIRSYNLLAARISWNFGDSGSQYNNDLHGFNAAHNFSHSGFYTIRATIEDPSFIGAIPTFTVTVRITDLPSTSGPQTIKVQSPDDLIALQQSLFNRTLHSGIQVLFARGKTFDFSRDGNTTLHYGGPIDLSGTNPSNPSSPKVAYTNLYIGSYDAGFGNAQPVLLWHGEGEKNPPAAAYLVSFFTSNPANINVTFDNLKFDSIGSDGVTPLAQDHAPKITNALGSNLSLINCSIGRVDGFDETTAGHGFLLQDNQPGTIKNASNQDVPTAVNGYFLNIASATEVVAIHNTVADTVYKPDMRFEYDTQRVLAYDNNLSMHARTDQGQNNAAFRVSCGGYVYAEKNTLYAPSNSLGPLDGPVSTTNKQETTQYVIFDSNTLSQFPAPPSSPTAPPTEPNKGDGNRLTLLPGLTHVVIRNNLFFGGARIHFEGDGSRITVNGPAHSRTGQDVWIVNNTRIDSAGNEFIDYGGHPFPAFNQDGINLPKTPSPATVEWVNIHIANNLSARMNSTTALVDGVSLDALTTSPLLGTADDHGWRKELRGALGAEEPNPSPARLPSRWWVADNVWTTASHFKVDSVILPLNVNTSTSPDDSWNDLNPNPTFAGAPDTSDRELDVVLNSNYSPKSAIANICNAVAYGDPHTQLPLGLPVATWDYYGHVRSGAVTAGAVQFQS